MTELDYIIQHFEENFSRWRGRRIALCPGEYLEPVFRIFDPEYRFCHILDADSPEVPADIELVILTDVRTGKEPDYNRIRRSCQAQGVLLLDLFGLDQIALHRELNAQVYLSIPEWKALLSGYDIVTLLVAGPVAKYISLRNQWVLRPRFMAMYRWLISEGKTVLFFWDTEDQLEPLKTEGIELQNRLIQRTGGDQGFLQLALRNPGKKMIHVGIGTARDGIIPREYGMDSQLFRYFFHEISVTGRSEWFRADRDRLLEEIDRHDVISFDVFDTLLKRTVLYPENIFELVEERTGAKGFAACRQMIQTDCPQFSLDEIYACLQERCGYDEKTAQQLRQAELQAEATVIMPRDSMAEIFEYAKKKGKAVVLTTDMYLDPGLIEALLAKNGITGYHRLIVSNCFGVFKNEGLFEEVRRFAEGRGSILHIGDNYYADHLCAQEYGLDSFFVPSCLELARKNGYEGIISACSTLAERKLLGLGVALAFDDPFVRDRDRLIAGMVVAPLALGYLLWVCGMLAGKGYDWFLLSSRDGWILTDAYSRLQRLSGGNLPPAKYFYVNRHAAFLTVMDDAALVKEVIHPRDHDNDPPKLLRNLFGLSAEQLLPFDGETAEKYLNMHGALIREAAAQYRENYRKHLEREGIAGKKCAFMDLFAIGTSQKMLEKGVTGPMDGYYVGIPEYASVTAGNIRYFFDQDLMDYDTLMKTEVYFTSMEPALDHIDDKGSPAFAAEVRSAAFLGRIRRIHGLVRTFLARYIDVLYDPADTVRREQIFALCKTVNDYKVENDYYDDMIAKPIRTKP